MIAAPSTSREATLTGAPTGLTGTVTFQVIDPPAGTIMVAETTAGITEVDTGVYSKTFTTPTARGQYLILWTNGSVVVSEELEVTSSGGTAAAYDVSTDLGKVRLEVGDTDTANPIFADDEITYFLTEEGSVLAAAARACETLAARYAGSYRFKTDDQEFDRGKLSEQYAAQAKRLRAQAGGATSVASTRIDGYSTDIANDEASTVNPTTGRTVRSGYTSPDNPS